MIPWIELHAINLGPINIQVWGTFVALGFLVATWVALRRAKLQGIEPNYVWNLTPWILLSAFVGARLFHVLFYDPSWYLAHPWDAINPALPGFSMMGGVLGGFVAGLVYVLLCHPRAKSDADPGIQVWAMADLIAFVLPLGTGIGRIGCFLIHDHPGTLTHFVLGVKYPDGVRHDHGLYLSLLGWVMFVLFYVLGRKKHPPGYFAGLYLVIDGIARFILDFYRMGDTRYAGLTPTQWLLMLTVMAGIWILANKRGKLSKL